jgi:small conductance mechanosensitive channel
MEILDFFSRALEWIIQHGPKLALVVVLMFVGFRLARFISNKVLNLLKKGKEDMEFQKRAETLKSSLRFVLNIAIAVIALIMILGELGVEIGPIIAAAGILGLAVGFGAQSLVKDVISGFFILVDDQIRVGDVVQIADKGGLVENVNLRVTVLRDLAGNVHFIRNGQIDVVTNMTKDYSRYVFEVGVAYREDVDEIVEILKSVDEDLRNDPEFADDIIEPIEVLGLDQFADSAIVIKARTTTKPIKQWRVAREFNRRLKKEFDRRDIEIPFPHLTIYAGTDKEGQAPPLHVAMQEKKDLE